MLFKLVLYVHYVHGHAKLKGYAFYHILGNVSGIRIPGFESSDKVDAHHIISHFLYKGCCDKGVDAAADCYGC